MLYNVKEFNERVIKDGLSLREMIEGDVEYICYLIADENGIVDPASKKYCDLKEETAKRFNIKCKTIVMYKDEFINAMKEISGEKIRAILQLPCPKECIDVFYKNVKKGVIIDVDNLGNDVYHDMWDGNFDRIPATPRGVVSLLLDICPTLEGKTVAIVGSRSRTVGKFLVPLLQSHNCTVTLYHSKSNISFGEFSDKSIIISCVGKPRGITCHHINGENRILIDVGVSIVDGRAIGDFDESCREGNIVTPYVNGIGLLTRAFLCMNCIDSYFR